jgi:ribosome-binding ATPase YchF (GTP1/OBG family)
MEKKQIERLVKDEAVKIINQEIDRFIKDSLDDEITKLMKKNNSKTRKEQLETIKKAMESVYKMMWIKRDFWKTDIH